MFQLKISARIYFLVALFLVALGVMTYININSSNSLRAETRDLELKSIADSALSITTAQYARFQAGEITEEEAKKLSTTTISQMRYRGTEYVFINDFNGVMVMNPITPDLVGTDRSQLPDKNGKLFQLEMMTRAKNEGSGYIDYAWTRPGSDAAVDKRTYFTAFKPWGWTIGTGVYVDDLRAQAFDDMVKHGGIAAAIVGVMMLVAWLISRTITGPITRLTATMGRIVAGQLSEVVDGQARKD
jgi:methyl-accepting chemotaxis protein